MRDDEPVDLSVLDIDDVHWKRMLSDTRQRVDVVLDERTNPLVTVASWRRPLLVAAAGLVALLVPVELMLEVREADAARVDALVQLSTRALRADQQPTASELVHLTRNGLRP
jgi:hypothetical protein